MARVSRSYSSPSRSYSPPPRPTPSRPGSPSTPSRPSAPSRTPTPIFEGVYHNQRAYTQVDLWDPLAISSAKDGYVLTNVEIAVTNLCNLRCQHCGVGNLLTMDEPALIPTRLLLHRLDEVKTLRTINITGGEPLFNRRVVEDVVFPLLRYAKDRGLLTQMNSNLTFELNHYLPLLEFVDILHISFNYCEAEDFAQIAFARRPRWSKKAAYPLYEKLCENISRLSYMGLFISAETLLTTANLDRLPRINRLLATLGVRRQEVQTLFPSGFAAQASLPSLPSMIRALEQLLDQRVPEVWLLISCPPVFECTFDTARSLLRRLRETPNVSVRNCPDGRIRLNVNAVTGDVRISDLATLPPLGNICTDSLMDLHARWLIDWNGHPVLSRYSCCCPHLGCSGPCLVVGTTYYPDTDFRILKRLMEQEAWSR